MTIATLVIYLNYSSELERVLGKDFAEYVDNWKQNDEAWQELEVKFDTSNIVIWYQQQSAHPFLVEYNRRIKFQHNNKQSELHKMSLNPGGRTEIKIYGEPNSIILEDIWGLYILDLKNMTLKEPDESMDTSKLTYLGIINEDQNGQLLFRYSS